MLKISCKNENLKRCLKEKETPRLLYPIFRCFFTKKNNFVLREKDLVLFSQTHFQSYLLHTNRRILFNLPFSKTRTICFLTGRSRSVYRAFHLSRLKLREFAASGYFSGLSKASW